jgi:hypothetical protein
MNTRIRVLTICALVALSVGLSSTLQPVAALNDCKQMIGTLNAVNNGSSATGIITQAGRLNGTTEAVHTSGFTPTSDPTTFSFTDDLTLTTNKGTLRTHNVVIFDVARGLFTAIARVDPNASTGDFAGATGVLYLNGKTTDGGATVQAEITGEICFAN